MGATDQMLARYMAEIEERQKFVDGIFKAADGKDLTDDQLELVTDTRNRMEEVNDKIEPLMEMRRISRRLRRTDRGSSPSTCRTSPPEPRARSSTAPPAQYVLDYWKARSAPTDAMQRLDLYNRAAAHQTTADNPGLLPTPIVEPVINFVDPARPIDDVARAPPDPVRTRGRGRRSRSTRPWRCSRPARRTSSCRRR